jgi:hypothetical protein
MLDRTTLSKSKLKELATPIREARAQLAAPRPR